MIQRIQTLWMLLAAIAVFMTIQFPFYSGTLAENNAYQGIYATNNIFLLILTSALGTGIIINIFLFRQRSVQFRILLVSLFVECLIIYLYFQQISKYSAGNFSLWSALHVLVILFLIFAAKGVYNDSKLIKESNRLR